MGIQPELRLQMYETMLRIRRFEEETAALFAAGDLPGAWAAEAIAACVAQPVFTYLDNHVTLIARGAISCLLMSLLGPAPLLPLRV